MNEQQATPSEQPMEPTQPAEEVVKEVETDDVPGPDDCIATKGDVDAVLDACKELTKAVADLAKKVEEIHIKTFKAGKF